MSWFSIIGRMSLDTTQFDAGLKKAGSTATAFGTTIGSNLKGMIAGAFSVGAVTAFTRSVISAADRVGDLAEQFGMTNEEVQKLQVLASKTGVPFEKMAQSIVKFSDIRAKAAGGDHNAGGLLGRMGLNDSDIRGAQSNLDLLVKMSERVNSGARSIQQNADVLEVFGAKGVTVANTLKGIKELGPIKIFSDDDIKAIGKLDDSLTELKRQALLAAAPTLGFWGNVLKRGNEAKGWGILKYLDAVGDELLDEGPTTSEALPRLDRQISTGSSDLGMMMDDEAWFEAASNGKIKAEKVEGMKEPKKFNPFMDPGGMAQSGFGYFGGGYNQQVLSELGKQVKALEKIVTTTTATAEALKPE